MLAGMVVMLGASVALAGAECTRSKAAKTCPANGATVTGEVTAVDAAAGKISIKDAKGVVTDWTVPADAKIMCPGKKDAGLAGIAVGSMVTVCYTETGGVKVVKSVKLKPAKKAKAVKAKADKGSK
jgi:Cu/Ag efflux protein CusF